MTMKIGDKIPEMLGVDANGKEVKASDYAGKRLAIYFYPKDNTPGCTAEACSLRDGYDALRSAGYGKKRKWQDGSIWVRCAPRFL